MNELKIIEHKKFGTIRTITDRDVILFCGKDVAVALGYKDPKKAVARHCKGGTKYPIQTSRGMQEATFITEDDVCRLVMRSNLPGAEEFKDWVLDNGFAIYKEETNNSYKSTNLIEIDKNNNNLMAFENPKFGEIRSLAIDGEPWLVAADVCRALEISNPTDALKRLDDDEKARFNLGLSGGATNCVNEPGLYSLVLGSRKPEAKAFKRWIVHDVIPAIRKHGVYATPETVEHLLGDPDFAIQTFTALKEEREKRMALELENARQKTAIAVMEPKADYHDIILQCKDLVPISVIAKDYGWSAIRMNKYLHEKGVQYKRGDTWMLYQKYAECGYTGTKTHEFKDDYDCSHAKIQTYWTQAGRLFIYNLLKEDGMFPLVKNQSVA